MLTVTRASSVIALSAALIASVALPASANGDTTVTLTVAGGTLAISAPGSADFGTVTPGLPATVLLQDVNVTDTRAGTAGWVAQVASTNFVGTNDPTNSIPASAALYTPAVAIPTGVVVVTPGLPAKLSTAPQAAQTATAVTGNNSATWAADLLVNVPSTTLADTYTATLTHSVL